jgi:hypothetical protein
MGAKSPGGLDAPKNWRSICSRKRSLALGDRRSSHRKSAQFLRVSSASIFPNV